MSLILDALNRSERDRRGGDAVPGLATEHYPDSTAPGASWQQHLVWVALIVALLVIGWLVWERVADDPPAPETVSAQNAAPVALDEQAAPMAQPETQVQEAPREDVSSVGTPETQPRAPMPEPASAPTSPAIAELYSKPAASAPSPTANAAEPVSETPPQEVVTPEPVAVSSQAVSEESLDIEALVTQAENELHNARLAEHPAPFLSDISQQKKDAIPTLMYSRHDYSSDDTVASVTLNGKALKKGGRVGAGVRVVEILPDSVVLSHQGSEFRLRALNSWVNL